MFRKKKEDLHLYNLMKNKML